MTSPAITLAASQTRSEAETRFLAKAVIKARADLYSIYQTKTDGMDEDQLADLEIAKVAACREFNWAEDALRASVK